MTKTTATIDATETMSATALQDEFKRLSLAISQGDAKAEAELVKVESRLELITRTEKRRQAALQQEQANEAEATRQASAHAHAQNVAAHEVALAAKARAFSLVEQVVEELVSAVKLAVLEGNEAHASALRLGFSPGILASSQISTFISWRLGRDGENCAGLNDMAPVFPAMRVPLVAPKGN